MSYSFGVFVKQAGEKDFKMVYQTRDDDFTFRFDTSLCRSSNESNLLTLPFGVRHRCVDLKAGTEYEVHAASRSLSPRTDVVFRT